MPGVEALLSLGNPNLKLWANVRVTQHERDYLAAIRDFEASTLKTAGPIQPRKNPSHYSQPLLPTPAPGVATLMSNAIRGMGLATPVINPNARTTPITQTLFKEGKYIYSFLTSPQKRPGSATVSKAFHTKTWKVYAAEYYDDNNFHLLDKETAILTDARVCKAPHIIQNFDTFRVPRPLYAKYMLITEWCERGSIVEEGRRKSFTYHETCMIVDQVAKALAYLHAQGVVHRDIRPQHILVRTRTDSSLDICLSNFSRSAQISIATGGANDSVTHDSSAAAAQANRDHYAERGDKKLRADHLANPAAVDIWSLGVIALELATGSLPTIVYETAHEQDPVLVKDQQLTEPLLNHRNEMGKTPAATSDRLELPLVMLIMKMMNRSPSLRVTAEDLSRGTSILLEKMTNDVHIKYPHGQLPAIVAPRIHAASATAIYPFCIGWLEHLRPGALRIFLAYGGQAIPELAVVPSPVADVSPSPGSPVASPAASPGGDDGGDSSPAESEAGESSQSSRSPSPLRASPPRSPSSPSSSDSSGPGEDQDGVAEPSPPPLGST
ncbi:kinase-like domain-containing protein, partial [Pseudoneurospora amorphoporcata]